MSRTREPRDSGQVGTAVMLTVMIGLLGILMMVMLPIGAAGDQRTGAQSAADAAALGGAKQISTDLPDAVQDAIDSARTRGDLLRVLDTATCGLGGAGAQDFAARNVADVTAYCYQPFSDRIEVAVRSRRQEQKTGQHATARAVAKLGVDLGPCFLTDDPPPPDDPDPAPDPNPDPPPPPDTGTTLRCGDLSLHFTIDGTTGVPTPTTTLAAFRALFEPRLIG